MEDRKRFAKNLVGLAALLDKELPVSLQDLYWRAFKDEVSDDEFEAACNRAGLGLKFFPKPVELMEFIRPDQETVALDAWETLQRTIRRVGQYQSVLFQDGRLTHTVESLGGWEVVCLWETKDLSYRRHEFLKTYQALKDGGPPRTLLGLIERDNSGRGYLAHVPPPVVVGGQEVGQIEGPT